jgi:hypothetical protein
MERLNMRKHFRAVGVITFSLILAASVAADVKVKSRQTMGGQSYDSTTYIKGKRSRTESMNGAMINITQCDLRRSIQINPSTRTYMINQFAETVVNSRTSPAAKTDGVVRAGGTVTTTITTKDTGERKQMFGYAAKHLIITMETVSSPDACSPTDSKMQMDGWYIDAEFTLNCDYEQNYAANRYSQKGSCRDRYEIKQLGNAKRGYPVLEKISMFDQNGNETYSMTNEVIELSNAALDAGLFEIPAGHRQVTDAAQMYASNIYDLSAGSLLTARPQDALIQMISKLRV